ncbi:hypothetical protein [Desulfosporosinus shakirovi]|uniref:hypothetical protein n=1 Tax=Desulfosporosinus shakirovi TaxID=2885154 RepID=UPI001E3F7758|nr:hypothetical protein [Desulfosporosinus sp. SRJS8]MCB8818466.1 hypothetical protein [Desulfosporosinus sp. SRJS8]
MTKALVVASLRIRFPVLLFETHMYSIAYGKVYEIIGLYWSKKTRQDFLKR